MAESHPRGDDLPRYSPEADSRTRAGHGRDFGADLYYLYRAGRVSFPQKATAYVGYTEAAHALGPSLREQTALCGGPAVLERLADLRDRLQEELRRTAESLREVGPALVQIATTYAETDEDASEKFRELAGRAAPEDRVVVPTPPQPPRTGDPQPEVATPPRTGHVEAR